MLNPIEAYKSAGRLAAQAINVNDGTAWKFHKDWADRAFRLETEANAVLAKQAYADAYKRARNVPCVR